MYIELIFQQYHKSHFYVQENTKHETSKYEGRKNFSQMIINNCRVEYPKPEITQGKHQMHYVKSLKLRS